MIQAKNPEHAQRLHDERRARDPDHDRVSCWCCCLDCNFDVERLLKVKVDGT